MSFLNYCDDCFESQKEGCFSMSKAICRKHFEINSVKIQSLEQELARLKEENLKLKRCENCYHFDITDECSLNSVSCIRYDKWEPRK